MQSTPGAVPSNDMSYLSGAATGQKTALLVLTNSTSKHHIFMCIVIKTSSTESRKREPLDFPLWSGCFFFFKHLLNNIHGCNQMLAEERYDTVNCGDVPVSHPASAGTVLSDTQDRHLG